MTKWADFVISAFKKGSGLSNISHVQIHEDLEHGLTAPKLIDKHEISSKIQKGISFITIFKKNENEWIAGDMVRTYVKDGDVFIRTDDNKVTSDNLGTLPTVDELEIVLTEIKPEPKPEPKPELKPEPKLELKPELKPEPKPEPKPNVETGDYEYEDNRRTSLAKEAENIRSAKSLPKGWNAEPKEKEVSRWNEDGTFNSSFKKEQEKEFLEFEKKYLENFEKDKSKRKKLNEKLKETEQTEHKARISRRLELEKELGKNYEKLLTEISKPEPKPESVSKPRKIKTETERKPSVESRISDVLKRVISTKDTSTKDTSTKIADDTRNFIRKKRTAPKPEPKTKPLESKTKVKPSKLTSTNSDEDKKRELLANEALKSRSTKSLPKSNVVKDERNSTRAQENEIAEIKAQAVADAKKQAEKETSTIVERLQKQIDTANESLEKLHKENEEIKRVKRESEEKTKREAEEKAAAEAKAAKEQIERQEAEKRARIEAEEKAKRDAEKKAAAEAKAAQEQIQKELAEAKEQLKREEAEEKAALERELAEAKAAKEQLEKEELSQTNDLDLASELKTELANLRKQLESIKDD